MAEIRAEYADFSLRCTYTARNGYTYSSDVTQVISIPISIPEGYTINSAYFTATTSQNPYYGGVLKYDGVRYEIGQTRIPVALNSEATSYSTTLTFNTWGNENATPGQVHSTTLYVKNIAIVLDVSSTVTKCTPPTSGSIDKTEVSTDDPVLMTWSGATGGQNNAIVGYEIEYSDGDSAWAYLANATTNSLYLTPGPKDVVRVFRVKAYGQAGAEYASDWYYMPGYLKRTDTPGGGGTVIPANPHNNMPPYKTVNVWRRIG